MAGVDFLRWQITSSVGVGCLVVGLEKALARLKMVPMVRSAKFFVQAVHDY